MVSRGGVGLPGRDRLEAIDVTRVPGGQGRVVAPHASVPASGRTGRPRCSLSTRRYSRPPWRRSGRASRASASSMTSTAWGRACGSRARVAGLARTLRPRAVAAASFHPMRCSFRSAATGARLAGAGVAPADHRRPGGRGPPRPGRADSRATRISCCSWGGWSRRRAWATSSTRSRSLHARGRPVPGPDHRGGPRALRCSSSARRRSATGVRFAGSVSDADARSRDRRLAGADPAVAPRGMGAGGHRGRIARDALHRLRHPRRARAARAAAGSGLLVTPGPEALADAIEELRPRPRTRTSGSATMAGQWRRR